MTLTREEKETIIVFNESQEPASIFTYNRIWQKHLEGKLGLKPVKVNSFGGKEYEIDKSRIKPPRAPKKLTEKQKKAGADRLKKARLSKKSLYTA